jgi:uncharacterized protein
MNKEARSRIIFDTNTLLSAAIFPNSVPALAFRKALTEYDVCVSDETLLELGLNLQKPKFNKYFAENGVSRTRFYADYSLFALNIPITIEVTDCQYANDNKFLSLALSSGASLLVTGDKKDLISMQPYRGVSIMTARDFLEQ